MDETPGTQVAGFAFEGRRGDRGKPGGGLVPETGPSDPSSSDHQVAKF